MNKTILITLLCLTSINGFAIDFYEPGDTLWIWAKNGLNIREQPDVLSKILGVAENGGQVIALDYQDSAFPYAVEVTNKSVHIITDKEKVEYPNFELTGFWAKVNYHGMVGYVFDGYLSRLQTFIGHQYEQDSQEDFHVLSLKKYDRILKQIEEHKYVEGDHKLVRYIFDTGTIVEINRGSGYWEKEMLFPNNLSLMEGYLIYSLTMKSDEDILVEKDTDYIKFKRSLGSLTIKKIGSYLVIYEEYSC